MEMCKILHSLSASQDIEICKAWSLRIAEFIIESNILLKLSSFFLFNSIVLIVWTTRNMDTNYLQEINQFLSRSSSPKQSLDRKISSSSKKLEYLNATSEISSDSQEFSYRSPIGSQYSKYDISKGSSSTKNSQSFRLSSSFQSSSKSIDFDTQSIQSLVSGDDDLSIVSRSDALISEHSVVNQSAKNPTVLIGWRILVQGRGTGLVLASEKRKFSSTKFVISFDSGKTLSVSLKRSEKKGREPFILLSKMK